MSSESEILFKALQIMPRTYDYIRQMAIQNVYDAIPELLTNSSDAYNRISNYDDIKRIDLEIILPSTIRVRDYATGFSAAQMKKSLLQVGNYTADFSSRGMMGRGAKDITILGDVLYESIKNDVYSKCLLKQDATGAILIDDLPSTPEDRLSAGILEGNGTQVTLNMLPRYVLENPETIYELILNDYELRDLFSSDKFNFQMKVLSNNTIVLDRQLKYTYPEGKQIFNITYNIDGYDGAHATLSLFRADRPIRPPRMLRDIQNGIVVSSNVAIYQCNFLKTDYSYNPANTKVIYGRLKCDYLHNMLLDLNENGTSEKNPYTILDPSRRQGLNVMHPFVSSLFKVAGDWLSIVMSNLSDKHDDSNFLDEDLKNIMDVLQNIGKDLLQKSLFDPWKNRRLNDLAKATIEQISDLMIDPDNIHIDQSIADQLRENNLADLDPVQEANPNNFRIVFTDDPTMSYKYALYNNKDSTILKLNIDNISLRPYFTNVEGVIEQNENTIELSTLTILAIVTECFGRLIGKTDFVNREIPLSALQSNEIHDKIFDIYEENATIVEKEFYKSAYSYLYDKSS